MMNEVVLGLAFFASGFSVAVIVFYSEIKLGIQLKRQAKAKLVETVH